MYVKDLKISRFHSGTFVLTRETTYMILYLNHS